MYLLSCKHTIFTFFLRSLTQPSGIITEIAEKVWFYRIHQSLLLCKMQHFQVYACAVMDLAGLREI